MPSKNNFRLLAAIMFADMVGYTKLMQQDEQMAKDLRDRQRAVVDKSIAKYRGQVMQYYGDGTLSMFGSALDAVNCAKEIQETLQEEPQVPLRIGIHIGDVVYDDEGIYGDAVNIAARVQGLGTPGSVMFTNKVFDEIKNHRGIRVEAFGNHELKNVIDPVGIYALASKGLETPSQSYIQEMTGSHQNSVAVLPFANFSGDKEHEYFSDGITEEIINALVRLKGLQVTSRTSVFAYKNTNKDIREIGRELNVATVLEGSVRHAGNRIRVTAQLIKTDDGFHIWSENYDGELKDIFKVQDEISKKIAEKLESNFTFESDSKLYEASTENVDAYNDYLQGLFYWNKRTPEAVKKAIGFFEKAVSCCDTYTKAYSNLANCYTFLATIGHMQTDEAYTKAEEYALKAIQLNNLRAGSYTALGYVKMFKHWDFDAADSCFRKAITLEPENVEARLGFSFYNRVVGRYDKMLLHSKVASKIAPLSLPAKLNLASSHSLLENYAEALELYKQILELDPNYRTAYEGMALVYAFQKDYDMATKYIKKYLKLIDGPFKGGAQLGYIAAVKGEVEDAKKYIEDVKQREEENPHLNLSLDFAIIYTGLGAYDKAFDYLFQAADQKLGSVLLLNSLPPFNVLRSDPRFNQLLDRIGLPKEVQTV
ncbi:adenylate/guanylate cyclase domain-containing protein [Balneola vulgaris]|uniref:adenylate/guanylate cyclase domain-containing protein n=1 Tax=Balneola vulgaris TaxID=287535 RepID=UPI00036EA618|nr:adenylate/guanylate cyclase domain-containing protein [Balneola vulgaris]